MTPRASPLLTVCGLDEIEEHGSRAVTHVLSILDPGWPDPAFGRYPPVSRTVLRFHDAVEPGPGVILPGEADAEAVLAFGRAVAADPGGPQAHLLVHCHMGISRSTAAMVAILAQAAPDGDEDGVVARVEAIRPQAWPNLRLIELCDAALGRAGRLTGAVGRLYRRRLDAKPDLADTMEKLGRGREVALARG